VDIVAVFVSLTLCEQDLKHLESFSWYSSLYEYSRPPVDEDDEEPELGPDGDLVSAMISTAIVPQLCKVIENGAFDPYSAKSLRRMLELAEQVEAYVDGDNAKFQVNSPPDTYLNGK
jgi:GC-rich sequence DNA-binding factor